MNAASARQELEALRAAGAARADAVGWHYIETLARRAQSLSGPAHQRVLNKLQVEIQRFEVRMKATQTAPSGQEVRPVSPSAMAVLLQELGATTIFPNAGHGQRRADRPSLQRLKKQLSQLSVHQQITQAIAQAPQNAGPINSQMLVLRSLGLMHEASADYLSRFMVYVDTLLYLDEAASHRVALRRPSAAAGSKT